MREVILARHGESDYSVRGLLNGDPAVVCDLTEEGIDQARRLAIELARVDLDLCVTSEFLRARTTADEALAGRNVPRLVAADFNDPRYGRFEGATLADYRVWATDASSAEPAPGGGESRHAVVARYARGFGWLLERPEASVLLVAHSLPIAFVLNAAAGTAPRPRTALVDYALPHRLDRDALGRAVDVLDGWLAAPDW